MISTTADTLVLSRLIDGGPLSYAVVVALPDNVGIRRKSKDAFDGFAMHDKFRIVTEHGERIIDSPNLNVPASINPCPDT